MFVSLSPVYVPEAIVGVEIFVIVPLKSAKSPGIAGMSSAVPFTPS